MSPQLEIILIASLVAMSCSLVGVFLVIRKLSMISDAISHTVLLGIVIVFIITKEVTSPWMFVGAIALGLITVALIGVIQKTDLVSEEASVGLVFPFLFSIAIVLISRYAGSVHLDTDAVLLGEIAFAPLDRIGVMGISVPKALLSALSVFTINAIVVKVFFKELKITSFDAILATTLGFSPIILNTILMSLVSLTAVSSFNAVGSILVIAFMIGPALTANLMTHDLKKIIGLSLIIAFVNVVVGYQIARILDVSIAGSMALFTGIHFTVIFFLSSESGYITRKIQLFKQKKSFHEAVVMFYLEEHPNQTYEALNKNIKVGERFLGKTLEHFIKMEYVIQDNMKYRLTDLGKSEVQNLDIQIFER